EAEGVQLFRLREAGLRLLSECDVSFTWSDNAFVAVSALISSVLKFARLADDLRLKLQIYIEGPGLVNEKLYRKMVANLPAPPPGQSLADKQPEIAKQWAYDLNAPLSPEHFRHQANKKIWWRCLEGHTWKVSINSRTQQGTGCPACPRRVISAPDERSLAVLNPGLASEWHPERNGDLRPEEVWPKSSRKVFWQCSKGHEWQAVVASRAAGSGCPYCYGRYATNTNNLAVKYPELLEEWDRERNKNLNPSDFTPHLGKKVWWRCRKGHGWQATIYNRSKNKSGCPVCAQNANRKYSIGDIQAIAIKRGGKCLSENYSNCKIKLQFCCKEGHIWEARADSVLYTNKWCPVCGRKR
ncbi:MAG: zinc-ribbon domain-containing protein, partial [Gammaproteobacteria bacterium]|nr:zinc-ribbon domain-containing protein [Gammaproteobacteria bacterium]